MTTLEHIPAEWVTPTEAFSAFCIRLPFDEDHTFFAIVNPDELLEAVKERKENRPDEEYYTHNIPLTQETYYVIENFNEKVKITKMPAWELSLLGAMCTAIDGDDGIEID